LNNVESLHKYVGMLSKSRPEDAMHSF